MAIISLKNISLTFGGPALLLDADLQVERGERIGLLGRNGAGKSTLLKLVYGEINPDSGEVSRQQQLRMAYLPQEVPQDLQGDLHSIVMSGLDGVFLAEHTEDESWQRQIAADQVIDRLGLAADDRFELLSAGMKRRALLARGLVREPDVLLLDEPTNHLDIDAIDWMETFLKRWGGTLLFVTHDRMFLDRVATRIIELDRGTLFDWHCDYATFRQRREAVEEARSEQDAEFDKKLAQEEAWIRRGVEARRTRNEGRVRALQRLRQIRRDRREQPGRVKVEIQKARRSGQLVLEAEHVGFQYDGQPILNDFSLTIQRGDRVGIVGPNGSGKTTLLRLLLGELKPQSGMIRLGTNLEIAYFDQLRVQLDESKSILDNVGQGRDFVTINGRPRNVIGYLDDFLFPKELIHAPILSLSGGERNRLLLARLFAMPANLIILDEPTNDLDIETLEILENLLLDFQGTILLVSHDRAFLNNLVTSTIVLDGNGSAREYVGGYDDWQKDTAAQAEAQKEAVPPPAAVKKNTPATATAEKPARLTYQEKRELETLPARIAALESEIERLHGMMEDPAFFLRDVAAVQMDTDRLQQLENELSQVFERWMALEQRA
ncbi:MAG: ATP-binding cassette domain-containing protein [Anaerolineae bacterium]|nr:ATP-binding cassette domain-containing protein [Anaerolineae bacterium]